MFPRKLVQNITKNLTVLNIIDFTVFLQLNLLYFLCFSADSFVNLHFMEKGIRKQRRYQSVPKYRFSTYCVRLREGAPPKHYYPPEETGLEKLENYVWEQRARRIRDAL